MDEKTLIARLRKLAEKNPRHPTKLWFDGVRELANEAADRIQDLESSLNDIM